MSNNYSMNLNLERLNKLNEKLNNVSAYPINFSKIQFLIKLDNNWRCEEFQIWIFDKQNNGFKWPSWRSHKSIIE